MTGLLKRGQTVWASTPSKKFLASPFSQKEASAVALQDVRQTGCRMQNPKILLMWLVVCGLSDQIFPATHNCLASHTQTAFIQLMQLTAFGNLMLAAFIILESRYRLYLKLDRR